MSDVVPHAEMMQLLQEKLKSTEGAAKCAEYGAAYLRDRSFELLRDGKINESTKQMFDKLVEILKACAVHLQPTTVPGGADAPS